MADSVDQPSPPPPAGDPPAGGDDTHSATTKSPSHSSTAPPEPAPTAPPSTGDAVSTIEPTIAPDQSLTTSEAPHSELSTGEKKAPKPKGPPVICSDPVRHPPKPPYRRKSLGWEEMLNRTTPDPVHPATTPSTTTTRRPLGHATDTDLLLKYNIPKKDAAKLHNYMRRSNKLDDDMDLSYLKNRSARLANLRSAPLNEVKINQTSHLRMQSMKHKMIVRCTGLVELIKQYNKMITDDNIEDFYQLRNKVMEKTNDELESEYELHELLELKSLADQVSGSKSAPPRANVVSTMRERGIRGVPVITTTFRNNFYEFRKPLYVPFARHPPKVNVKLLPTVDKTKETLLVPMSETLQEPEPMFSCREVVTRKPKYKPGQPSKRKKLRPPIKGRKPVNREDDYDDETSRGSSAGSSPDEDDYVNEDDGNRRRRAEMSDSDGESGAEDQSEGHTYASGSDGGRRRKKEKPPWRY